MALNVRFNAGFLTAEQAAALNELMDYVRRLAPGNIKAAPPLNISDLPSGVGFSIDTTAVDDLTVNGVFVLNGTTFQPLTVRDGTHTFTDVGTLTFSGATVTGTSGSGSTAGSATATISGGGGGSSNPPVNSIQTCNGGSGFASFSEFTMLADVYPDNAEVYTHLKMGGTGDSGTANVNGDTVAIQEITAFLGGTPTTTSLVRWHYIYDSTNQAQMIFEHFRSGVWTGGSAFGDMLNDGEQWNFYGNFQIAGGVSRGNLISDTSGVNVWFGGSSFNGFNINANGFNLTASQFGAFGVTPVTQQAGDVASGLVALGWFSSASYAAASITGSAAGIDSSAIHSGASAGGDLSGTYPNPTVAKLQGVPISTDAPSVGMVLQYDGTEWEPTALPADVDLPTVVASADLTGQTTAIAGVVTATIAGISTLRVNAYATITAIAVDVLQVQVTYTDETNSSRTQTFFPMGLTSANLATTGAFNLPPMVIRVKAGTVVSVNTVLTVGGGAIAYDVGAIIEQLE